MKLLEMDSILQGDRGLPATVAASNKEWHFLKNLFNEMDQLRQKGSDLLDTNLPSEFVIAVLSEVEGSCFLSNDGWLRSWRMDSNDKKLSFVDCFTRHGGQILEEVGEKGSVQVG